MCVSSTRVDFIPALSTLLLFAIFQARSRTALSAIYRTPSKSRLAKQLGDLLVESVASIHPLQQSFLQLVDCCACQYQCVVLQNAEHVQSVNRHHRVVLEMRRCDCQVTWHYVRPESTTTHGTKLQTSNKKNQMILGNTRIQLEIMNPSSAHLRVNEKH